MTECCGTCHFWRMTDRGYGTKDATITEGAEFADCRRRAPCPSAGQATTRRGYWCGEYAVAKRARAREPLVSVSENWLDRDERPAGFVTGATGYHCEVVREADINEVLPAVVWVTENGHIVFRVDDAWCTDVAKWRVAEGGSVNPSQV